MLNLKKRESLLQWFNCISIGKGIQSLKEIANGILLYQILISLSPTKAKEKEALQKAKEIESADKLNDLPDAVANHDQSLTEVLEQPVCQNDIDTNSFSKDESGAYDPSTSATNAIAENSTSLLNTNCEEPSDELKRTEHDDNNIVKNDPTESSTHLTEDECNTNVEVSLDAVKETNVENKSLVCVKNVPNLTNRECPMEVSLDNNFLKPAVVNHVVKSSSEMKSSLLNQHDISVSDSPDEPSASGSLGKVINTTNNEENPIPDIEKRYAAIKTFIDGMLDLQSETLLNFEECKKGNENELAKLTVLFLCSWLQSYLITDNFSFENTICHLHQDIQEEIKECLELFLIKRSTPVKRKEFQDMLAKGAKIRSSPRWSTPSSITPQARKANQTRKSKFRRNVKTLEEITIESSPLKDFLQSPDLRHITPKTKQAVIHDAVSKKNKEISELFEILEEERYKIKDLEEEIEKLKSKNCQLEEENAKTKGNLGNERNLFDEERENFFKEKKCLEEAVKKLQKQVEELQSDLKYVKDNDHQTDKEIPTVINSTAETTMNQEKNKPLLSPEDLLQIEKDKVENLKRNIESYIHIEKKFEELKYFCANEDECIENEKLQDFLWGLSAGKCQFHDFTIKTLSCEEYSYLKKEAEKNVELKSNLTALEENLVEAHKKCETILNENKSLESQIEKLTTERDSYYKVLENSLKDQTSNIESLAISMSENVSIERHGTGQLWDLASENSRIYSEVPNSEEHSRHKSKRPSNSIPLLCDTRASYKRKSLINLLDEQLSTSNGVLTDSLAGVESTNGRPQCSASEFKKIKSCVMNLFKAIKSKDKKIDKLPSNIKEYEKNFESVQDLINALVLLCNIIECDFHVYPQSSDSQKIDTNEIEVIEEQITLSSSCDVERNVSTIKNVVEKPLDKKVLNNETVEPLNDKSELSCSQESELPLLKSCNELSQKDKIKGKESGVDLKQRYLEQQLTKAEDEKNKHIQNFFKISQEYEYLEKENESLKKEIESFKKRIRGLQQKTDKSIQTNKVCKMCSIKIEKLNLKEKKISSLKEDVNKRDQIIQVLEGKNKELNSLNKKLESRLDTLKCWNTGNYFTPLYKASERLSNSSEQEVKEPESEEKRESDSEPDGEEKPGSNKIMDPVVEDKRTWGNFSSRNSYKDSNMKQLSAFCFPEDEEDFPNESSISDVNPKYRLSELQWRNSMCLPHMQSIYPLELDNTPTASKYLKAPSPIASQLSNHKSKSVQYSNKQDRLKQHLFQEKTSQKKHFKPLKNNMPSTSKSSCTSTIWDTYSKSEDDEHLAKKQTSQKHFKPLKNNMLSTSKTSCTSKAWDTSSNSENDDHLTKRRKVSRSFAVSSHSGRNSQSIQRTLNQNSSTQKIFKTPQSFFRLVNHRRRPS